MDSYREHSNDFDHSSASDSSPPEQAHVDIGTDERRMHVRAYNYWVSLLGGRDYPSIEDLEPAKVADFASNSVLLDFTAGRDNPATPYIGTAIKEECDLGDGIKFISEVPSRSLLSRLTDHYLQIIANRAPIGFEAEFVNQRGDPISYRGILMPFSSDGDTIDFIYGVINWKRGQGAASVQEQPPQAPAEAAPEPAGDDDDELILDEPHVIDEPQPETETEIEAVIENDTETAIEVVAETVIEVETIEAADSVLSEAPVEPAATVHFSWEDGPLHDAESGEILPEILLDENAGLADRLWAARETADAVKDADSRSRSALYHALSNAYDFALATETHPGDYAELLEESGVKAQARAPMTPVVKLVFGIDYDKARLTEFAAALSFARRQDVELSGFLKFIEGQAGGLKALVAAERQARRPEPKTDTKTEAARAKLRTVEPIALETISADCEFALVLARRRADGGVEPVALVDDEAMVEKAIRRAGI